jgi:hypothetical protein
MASEFVSNLAVNVAPAISMTNPDRTPTPPDTSGIVGMRFPDSSLFDGFDR